MRNARSRSGIASIAVVGYTNAGKSSLMSALCHEVLCPPSLGYDLAAVVMHILFLTSNWSRLRRLVEACRPAAVLPVSLR